MLSLARGWAPRQFDALCVRTQLENVQSTEDNMSEPLAGNLPDLDVSSIRAQNALSLS
jgi:hypothetical protein